MFNEKIYLPKNYRPEAAAGFTLKEEKKSLKNRVAEKLAKTARLLLAAGILVMSHGLDMDTRNKGNEDEGSARSYLDYIGEKDEDRKAMYKEMAEYLEENFSDKIFVKMMLGNESAKTRAEKKPARPVIAGSEQLGINKSDLEELWSENGNYPKGVIYDNTSFILFKDEEAGIPEKYNISDESALSLSEGEQRDAIIFLKDGRSKEKKITPDKTIHLLDEIAAHEFAHLGDPIWHNRLQPEERLKFMHQLAKTYESPDSMCRDFTPFHFIENINNPDPRKEKMNKILEYYAFLCQFFMRYPDDFVRLASDDENKLVREWYCRFDPDFNPSEALKRREMIIAGLSRSNKIAGLKINQPR